MGKKHRGREAVWAASDDFGALLAGLPEPVSHRKMRLLAVAFARTLLPRMKHPCSRRAVEIAEQYADGQSTSEDLVQVFNEASLVYEDLWHFAGETRWAAGRVTKAKHAERAHADATRLAEEAFAAEAAAISADAPSDIVRRFSTGPDWCPAPEVANRTLSRLLREMVGDPFCPVSLDSAWLDAHAGLAKQVAEQAYDRKRFTDLPVIADVLEEAGCEEADLLKHLRSSDDHVRGCWALDLLLGKA